VLTLLPQPKQNEASDPRVAKIINLLGQLDAVLSARREIERRVSEMHNGDDIAPLLMRSNEHETVFAEQLRKYSAVQAEMQNSLQLQEKILPEVFDEYAQFVQATQSDSAQQERILVLNKFDLAFKAYLELKSNLTEGIQFYSNLQEILKKFVQNCRDFYFARQTEKNDHVSRLEKSKPHTQIHAPVQMPQHVTQMPQHVTQMPPQYPVMQYPSQAPQPSQLPPQYGNYPGIMPTAPAHTPPPSYAQTPQPQAFTAAPVGYPPPSAMQPNYHQPPPHELQMLMQQQQFLLQQQLMQQQQQQQQQERPPPYPYSQFLNPK
jgi:programmed cell death 6-interacting protein